MSLIDCHTHTANSPDGEGTVHQLMKRGAELGLTALGVSEHVEANRFYSAKHYNASPRHPFEIFDYADVFEKSMAEISEAKSGGRACPELLCGIELGQPYADYNLSESIISDARLDYVIASAHELTDTGKFMDFAFVNYTVENAYTYVEQYFERVYDMCCWGKFDILGHLTYPLRYIVGTFGIDLDLSEFDYIIAEIFKKLAENGCALEINTSGLRQLYGNTFPTPKYVKMYKNLGGELLTIGSDAHRAGDLGKGIKDGTEIALAAGFSHLCFFRKRKAIFLKI